MAETKLYYGSCRILRSIKANVSVYATSEVEAIQLIEKGQLADEDAYSSETLKVDRVSIQGFEDE